MNGVKRLLTVKDVALMLSAKESTVYQWAELGQIPCIKLNGSLRFDIDDISVWIESCKKQVTSAYNPLLRLEARKGGEN
ncbi:MAG: helix-turn-helix domain-containing protein [Nitrospirae bacterium]|nr:helix-turn-helix domain-containing protein [Nitrospirota bacterium]MCL5238473.1 helix-turn-helix domain-containing protein [Nitrospirota bacterium]